jgi:hypothetical protein
MHALELWLKGLVAACIGGGANAVTVVFVDPEHFNAQDGLHAMLKVAAVGALVSILGYLRQVRCPVSAYSPLKAQEAVWPGGKDIDGPTDLRGDPTQRLAFRAPNMNSQQRAMETPREI